MLISSKDMEYFQRLVSKALTGKMSTPVQRGADMGAILCKIIVPDPFYPPNNYREVILSQTGDIESHNLSPEAAVIAEWLTGLGIH